MQKVNFLPCFRGGFGAFLWIYRVRIMKGKDSGENKGFAFVTFRSAELASQAIDKLNNTEFKKLGRAGSKEACPGGWAWSYTAVELVKDAKNPAIIGALLLLTTITMHVLSIQGRRSDLLIKDNTISRKNVKQKKVKTKEKKTYTPFPPRRQPSKIDEQLASGEFIMSLKKKSSKKWQEKQEKQTEKTAENKRKREAAFIPLEEPRKMDAKSEDDNKDMAAMAMSLKKKAEEFGKQKSVENIETEADIAAAGEPSKNKSKGAASRV